MNLQTIIAATFASTFFTALTAAVNASLQEHGISPNECEMYDIDGDTIGVRYRGSLLLKLHKPDIKMQPGGMTVRAKISGITH